MSALRLIMVPYHKYGLVVIFNLLTVLMSLSVETKIVHYIFLPNFQESSEGDEENY